jgi:hypothetical protein
MSRPKRSPTLGGFIDHLAGITPHPERPITPDSRLLDDLDFDAIAFGSLGLLMAELYGIGGVSTDSLRSENLTVEMFFERCVLQKVTGLNGKHRVSPAE